mgnify:CR=1 FL=1
MDHPVAVRTEKDQLGGLRLVAWLELVDGSGVMHLDEALADVAVALLEHHLAA